MIVFEIDNWKHKHDVYVYLYSQTAIAWTLYQSLYRSSTTGLFQSYAVQFVYNFGCYCNLR